MAKNNGSGIESEKYQHGAPYDMSGGEWYGLVTWGRRKRANRKRKKMSGWRIGVKAWRNEKPA
jgi:hypothetical protein